MKYQTAEIPTSVDLEILKLKANSLLDSNFEKVAIILNLLNII